MSHIYLGDDLGGGSANDGEESDGELHFEREVWLLLERLIDKAIWLKRVCWKECLVSESVLLDMGGEGKKEDQGAAGSGFEIYEGRLPESGWHGGRTHINAFASLHHPVLGNVWPCAGWADLGGLP